MDTEIPLSPQWLMKVGENKVSLLTLSSGNHVIGIINGCCSNIIISFWYKLVLTVYSCMAI